MFLEKNPFSYETKRGFILENAYNRLNCKVISLVKNKCNELVDFTAFHLLIFKCTKPSSLFTPCFIVALMNLS